MLPETVMGVRLHPNLTYERVEAVSTIENQTSNLGENEIASEEKIKKQWKTPKMSEISIVEDTRSTTISGTDGLTSPQNP